MRPESYRVRKAPGGTGEALLTFGHRVIARHAIFSLAVILVYLLLNRPEVIMVSHFGFTVWYPATGLILAVMLGISPWYFPLTVFASALAGAVIYHQPVLSWSGMVAPVLGSGCYAIAASLLRGPLKIDPALRQRQDVVRYVSVTLAAAVFATATGVACLAADRTISWSQYWNSALGWYVGDVVGLVGFAPFLLIHVLPWVRWMLSPHPEKNPRREDWSETRTEQITLGDMLQLLGQVASIVLVLWIMFGRALGYRQLYYLAFVPIVWIAMRHGIRHVVSGLLVFNFGIVIALKLYPVTPDSLTKVGLLMLTVSGTGLIVGAAVSERHRMAKQLSERTDFLNSLIENNPLGIVVHDREGRVQLCNEAFANLFLYSREEMVGHFLDPLISQPDDAGEASALRARATSGNSVHETVSRRRKDGKMLDLDLHAVTISLDGRTDGAYAIYKDISEQVKAAAQARDHSESLNRLVNELQLHTTQMTLLNEMGDLLQCSATSAEAHAVVGQVARRLFLTSTGGALFVFKSSRNLLEAVASWGKNEVSDKSFAPDACWGLRRGQPCWSEHPGGVVICAHLKNPVPASYLCVPLVAQGDTLGVLHIQYDLSDSNKATKAFETLQESQRRLAVAVGGRVALSLAGLLLREILRDQSIRDSLTGLFNRRFMEDALARELQRAKRKRHPLVVVFLDLDHFKQYNDIHGHDAGDAVLRSMAGLFQQHFRGEDVVCRYGGEEFAFILPESSTKNAAKRVEELRQVAKRHKITYKEQVLDAVTFSVGIAAYPENGLTGEELLQTADTCLYESKANGRDCVTIATSHKSLVSRL
ncbi:MAG TPA: diguanylate cyclase [Candidatus Dormibacteraeota bacterium]|nr:diguanylate cyclase [Candidatus Dormibacteraeota bacterium]